MAVRAGSDSEPDWRQRYCFNARASESSEDGDLDPYFLELVHAKLAVFDLPLPKL